MLTKKACKLLHDAEEILAKPRGWTKGHFKNRYEDGRPQFCLVGAIREAAGEQESLRAPSYYSKPLRDAVAALSKQLGGNGHQSDVIAFNDKRSTRKKDVLELLRKTREAEGC